MSSEFFEGIGARAVGEQFPLSIATELAIESACGTHPDIPVKVAPILSTDQLWVNVRTLFRNFMGALDKDTGRGVVPYAIATALIEEMDTIESIIGQYSKGRTKVVFYLSNYKGLEQRYKFAKVRMDNTDKQKAYRATMNDTMDNLLKMVPDKIVGFDLKIGNTSSHNANTMLLTHYAYDLLSYQEFGELVLLESHTGSIKQRAQWYTKYKDGKELAMMPFREDLMQVFGDSETFAPLDNRLRKALIELATLKRWSATTTTDKIKSNLREMNNQFAAEILRNIIK